jgi:hypothetical protein
MLSFSKATILGSTPVKIASTLSPDSRTLSVLLEGARCRDRGEPHARYASLSFDIGVEVAGDGIEDFTVDLRGAEARDDPDAFSVLRIQCGPQRITVTGREPDGEVEGRLTVRDGRAGQVQIAILLLANAGSNPASESLLDLDSLDLAFSQAV